ncbi:MAG: hypothetical protein IKZ82_06235 [Clostridia bacterium]|nr:hypothetical protein [Clostridia bacterium]
MKVGQFLKLYHAGSSSAEVVLHFYDTRTKESERAELSRYEVANIDRCDFAFKTFKVESFAVSYDDLFHRPVLDLYTSYESQGVER